MDDNSANPEDEQGREKAEKEKQSKKERKTKLRQLVMEQRETNQITGPGSKRVREESTDQPDHRYFSIYVFMIDVLSMANTPSATRTLYP
jgi:hypothetical protein